MISVNFNYTRQQGHQYLALKHFTRLTIVQFFIGCRSFCPKHTFLADSCPRKCISYAFIITLVSHRLKYTNMAPHRVAWIGKSGLHSTLIYFKCLLFFQDPDYTFSRISEALHVDERTLQFKHPRYRVL